MGIEKVLESLINVSPFVAIMGIACWMLWKKNNEKDKLLNDQRKEALEISEKNRSEVMESYRENIKVMEGVTSLISGMKSDMQRDFRDVHARLDRLENAKQRND